MTDAMKKASEYMRQGAKLTQETCPVCDFFVLEREGDLFCPNCERKVIITESKEDYVQESANLTLNRLRETLRQRVDAIVDKMEMGEETEDQIEALERYLNLLDKASKLTRSSTQPPEKE